MSRIRHLLTVWNPSYAESAMDAHLEVLLSWAEKSARAEAEDRRGASWLSIVTNCGTEPKLQEPIEDPSRRSWREVVKVQHDWMTVDALTQPMQVHEESGRFREEA